MHITSSSLKRSVQVSRYSCTATFTEWLQLLLLNPELKGLRFQNCEFTTSTPPMLFKGKQQIELVLYISAQTSSVLKTIQIGSDPTYSKKQIYELPSIRCFLNSTATKQQLCDINETHDHPYPTFLHSLKTSYFLHRLHFFSYSKRKYCSYEYFTYFSGYTWATLHSHLCSLNRKRTTEKPHKECWRGILETELSKVRWQRFLSLHKREENTKQNKRSPQTNKQTNPHT